MNIWGEAKNLLFSRKLFKKFNFWKERNFDTLEFCFLRKTFKENYPNFCICKTTNIAGFELGPRKDRLLGRAGMRRVGPGRHEPGQDGSRPEASYRPPGSNAVFFILSFVASPAFHLYFSMFFVSPPSILPFAIDVVDVLIFPCTVLLFTRLWRVTNCIVLRLFMFKLVLKLFWSDIISGLDNCCCIQDKVITGGLSCTWSMVSWTHISLPALLSDTKSRMINHI